MLARLLLVLLGLVAGWTMASIIADGPDALDRILVALADGSLDA